MARYGRDTGVRDLYRLHAPTAGAGGVTQRTREAWHVATRHTNCAGGEAGLWAFWPLPGEVVGGCLVLWTGYYTVRLPTPVITLGQPHPSG